MRNCNQSFAVLALYLACIIYVHLLCRIQDMKKIKSKNKIETKILESIDIPFWYAVREYMYLVPGCDCCQRHDPLSKWLFFVAR